MNDNNLPPLWSHQQKAIEMAKDKFLLCFDPGTGKTRAAIELFKSKAKGAQRLIIVAPLNVCENWVKEVGVYLNESFVIYLVVNKSQYQKQKILNEFLNSSLSRRHQILICNVEVFRSVEYRETIKKAKCNFFIIDESQNFKSPIAKQTKGLLECT